MPDQSKPQKRKLYSEITPEEQLEASKELRRRAVERVKERFKNLPKEKLIYLNQTHKEAVERKLESIAESKKQLLTTKEAISQMAKNIKGNNF